jgi:hypothetical protein
MALMRDASEVHEEKVTAAEEGKARCDACGRHLAPADLIGWDASDNDLAGEHTDANDLLWICRCCRDGGGVGRCDACDRLVPADDLMRVGPSKAVPEGIICTEC